MVSYLSSISAFNWKKLSKNQLERFNKIKPFMIVISFLFSALMFKVIWGNSLFEADVNFPLYLRYLFIAINYALLFAGGWFFSWVLLWRYIK